MLMEATNQGRAGLRAGKEVGQMRPAGQESQKYRQGEGLGMAGWQGACSGGGCRHPGPSQARGRLTCGRGLAWVRGRSAGPLLTCGRWVLEPGARTVLQDKLQSLPSARPDRAKVGPHSPQPKVPSRTHQVSAPPPLPLVMEDTV